MSATNSTPNCQLPIFEATDKPTWQGDFNEAMNKIDTAIGDLDNEVTGVSGDITNIEQSIQTLGNNIAGVSSRVGTLERGIENKIILLNNSNIIAPSSVVFRYDENTRDIRYNDYMVQIECSFTVNNLDSSTLVNEFARTPLIKIPTNLFNLQQSAISDNNNKQHVADVWAFSGGSNLNHSNIFAYYDGNNTNLYIETAQSWGNTFWFFVDCVDLIVNN